MLWMTRVPLHPDHCWKIFLYCVYIWPPICISTNEFTWIILLAAVISTQKYFKKLCCTCGGSWHRRSYAGFWLSSFMQVSLHQQSPWQTKSHWPRISPPSCVCIILTLDITCVIQSCRNSCESYVPSQLHAHVCHNFSFNSLLVSINTKDGIIKVGKYLL